MSARAAKPRLCGVESPFDEPLRQRVEAVDRGRVERPDVAGQRVAVDVGPVIQPRLRVGAVETQDRLPSGDLLILVDEDRDDTARNLRSEVRERPLHERVVGRLAPAQQVPLIGAECEQRDHRADRDPARPMTTAERSDEPPRRAHGESPGARRIPARNSSTNVATTASIGCRSASAGS
jgi:hypothetical protein